MSTCEKILYAAVLYHDEVIFLPRPNRHPHVLWSIENYDHTGKQGFVTDSGRFVDRLEAFIIAKGADQVRQHPCATYINEGPYLFSEDLW